MLGTWWTKRKPAQSWRIVRNQSLWEGDGMGCFLGRENAAAKILCVKDLGESWEAWFADPATSRPHEGHEPGI